MAKLIDALCDYANLLNLLCIIFCLSFLYKNVKIKIYRNVILPVVLLSCKAWSLTIWEEKRVMFENRVLRKIYGPKMDEVQESGEEYTNEELHALHSPNINQALKSKRKRWAAHVVRMEHRRSTYIILVEKPDRRGHLEGLSLEGRIILK